MVSVQREGRHKRRKETGTRVEMDAVLYFTYYERRKKKGSCEDWKGPPREERWGEQRGEQLRVRYEDK